MSDESIRTPQDVTAGSDADIEVLLRSGKAHVTCQQPDKARAIFERVLDLEPHHPEAHYRLGHLHHAAQAYDLAEPYYRAALAATPPFGEAYLDLGLLYEEQGKPEDAAVVYRQCIELDVSPRRIARARAALAKQAGQPHKVCARCGRYTTLTEFGKRGSKKKFVCPRCIGEKQFNNFGDNLLALFISAIMLSLMLAAMLMAEGFNPLYALANTWLAVALLYVMIPFHELAHASVAWLVGGKVHEIKIGIGGEMWAKTWRGTKFSLRKYPVGGACVLSFPVRHRILWRVFLATAAGLALSGFILLISLPFYESWWLYEIAVAEALVWVNGWLLLTNLLPHKVVLGGVITKTDGGQLLALLRKKIPAEVYHLNHYVLESMYALQDQAFAQAAELCRAGLALYPDNPYLENVLAVANLELGNMAEAATVFKRQLEELDQRGTEAVGVTDETREGLRAILLNNVAMTLLLDGDGPEREPLMIAHAQQAYAIAPWVSAIEGTWGAVLIETGRPELGLTYLQAAHSDDESPRERASTLAYIAWAQQLLGRAQESEEAMQQALALDPGHYMVRRAQAMMRKAGDEVILDS